MDELAQYELLVNTVIAEIKSSEILVEEDKDAVISEVLHEVANFSQKCLFKCKMILFENRYCNIDKEKYFNWLLSTHLYELINLRRKQYEYFTSTGNC